MVSGNSFQQLRDNTGTPDDTKSLVLVGQFNEKIIVEECATYLAKRKIGDVFILGHHINGILGVANGTGGTQITLGIGKIGATTTHLKVTNPDNKFRERLRYTDFNDTTVSTATFDTTNHLIEFDKDEVYQTKELFKNDESIVYVTPYIETRGGSSSFVITQAMIDVSSYSLDINEGS
jgi:hypothetical protein